MSKVSFCPFLAYFSEMPHFVCLHVSKICLRNFFITTPKQLVIQIEWITQEEVSYFV